MTVRTSGTSVPRMATASASWARLTWLFQVAPPWTSWLRSTYKRSKTVAGVVCSHRGPKRFVSELVVDQGSYRPRELLEQSPVQTLVGVEHDHALKKGPGPRALGLIAPELTSVGGIHCDPLQDETQVGIGVFIFRADQPAQRPVDAQA